MFNKTLYFIKCKKLYSKTVNWCYKKEKISQMDESFLIASKALDKKKETELERLKDGGFMLGIVL